MSELITNYVEFFLTLIQLVCVIAVLAYLFTRRPMFERIINHNTTSLDTIICLLFFGALSIYGSITRTKILGAEVNVLDLGPMVGGLIGGPVVGVGSGIIGALFRYNLGGIAAEPCSLAAIVAGLLGGVVWYLNKRNFPSIGAVVIFAIGIEIIHDILALILITPYEVAESIVLQLTFPITLANVLGIAIFAIIIHNRISEERTRQERDRLGEEIYRRDVDMRAARQIQKHFLPAKVPDVDDISLAAVSVPAQDVGGDFYDFIYPIRENLLGLVIADVSGKGIPAALFMGLSKTLTWANLVREDSLISAIEGANHMIRVNATPGMFVTLWCGLLDTQSRELVYVNAGHPPPLLFREDGCMVNLKRTGMALGVFEKPYRQENIVLLKGDLLVLYTDGITEAINVSDEQYGIDRLIRVIQEHKDDPVSVIIQSVQDDLAGHCKGTDPFDDITMVAIRVME
ncbi:MAG TPA: SpoIIE family protein phosphatase [Methanospirillum sp.]|uniref:PP2C family protein-serine/threonine phosphatase n=1 Tax=Methanospirillum sp. TaxID=45200 RepID=UPI002B536A1D|nr:SpoIIE family protein phosphatase [Methanospirillum sp.]HWQ64470.1 SpoIIE family protein phosphatase [Methanospirillum sp.]